MDVLLWGSLGAYTAHSASSRTATPYLLAGITMFWTFTQAQFSIALGINEETWTRNILNVLTTPVKEVEYIIGIALFGLLKLALCLITLTISTIAFFGFDLHWSAHVKTVAAESYRYLVVINRHVTIKLPVPLCFNSYLIIQQELLVKENFK